jgi:hypothetical protein
MTSSATISKSSLSIPESVLSRLVASTATAALADAFASAVASALAIDVILDA